VKIVSQIKGPGLFSQMARLEYRALLPGQPIILQRQPGNIADKNAVVALTAFLQPCGYIAKEQAAIIAPDMDRGILWLCKVIHQATAMHCPRVILWTASGQTIHFTDAMLRCGASQAVADAVLRGAYTKEPEEAA